MPRTFLEEFRRNKNPQIEIELHKREIKRLFGELPVNSEFIDEYYHGERNETFHVKSKNIIYNNYDKEKAIRIRLWGNKIWRTYKNFNY